MDKLQLKAAIEKCWFERAKSFDLKPKSMAYKRAEVEFFAGAMTAINALRPSTDPELLSSDVPLSWVIHAMSGRPIAEAS